MAKRRDGVKGTNQETKKQKVDEEEKNITFYVKYGDEQPVGVETHFTLVGEERKRPLATVAHLITAFQNLQGSPLANVFMGNISLNATENGLVNETPLKINQE